MIKYVIALILALVLNATANLMIKFGMRGLDLDLGGSGLFEGGFGGTFRLLVRNWILLAGVGCFALNVVFYAYALRRMPISVAYPIMVSVGFAIIVVVAGLLLKERLTVLQWVGVAAVLCGVALVARDARLQLGGDSSSATGTNTSKENTPAFQSDD
jgi:multidrug transporter EmrE-like cation transporter